MPKNASIALDKDSVELVNSTIITPMLKSSVEPEKNSCALNCPETNFQIALP